MEREGGGRRKRNNKRKTEKKDEVCDPFWYLITGNKHSSITDF